MSFPYFAIVCAAVCLATPAFANDSSASLGAGGLMLTKTADVRMAAEDLFISPRQIRIRYEFVNDAPKDVDLLVAFPLPDIDAYEFFEEPLGTVTADPLNFVNFVVKQDGKTVPVQVEQRAFFQNRDVTAIVVKAGAPLNPVHPKYCTSLDKLPKAQTAALIKAGIGEMEGEYLHPHWTTRTKFFWTQHFPAGKTVVLEQSYQPVTGQAFFSRYDVQTDEKSKDSDANYWQKTYCMDKATLSTLARMIKARGAKGSEGAAPGLLATYSTDYILKTASNWKGPIGKFHLTLDKLAPANVLSLCWDGDLKKTGATRFEFSRENFAPAQDIKMVVIK
ncbi:MAG: DUF4424 family protein [Proteobacteria bacterium]|nr:DUF4424 family protein [Pseudomonadota bacterium]